jgi:predicted nuclease with TOPRIM domain
MDPNLTTAIVSACATALVAIVALILNSKRFEDMNKRFDDMNKRMDDMGKRIDRVEKTLEMIQSDLKEFFRTLAGLDKRLQRLEDKQQ